MTMVHIPRETLEDDPQVWVGCLACYNAGDLTGEWVDALEAAEFVPCTLVELGSPHEEFWCMDHQGFEGFLTGECSPMEAQAIAEKMTEIPDYIPSGAVAAYLGNTGDSISDFELSDFEDAYCGEFDSEEDYAQQLADDIGAIDDNATWPNSYIDWERATRDLFMGDNWSADAGGGSVWVFRSI